MRDTPSGPHVCCAGYMLEPAHESLPHQGEERDEFPTPLSEVELSSTVFSIAMRENSARATTVGDYLVRLLGDAWKYGEEFDGKRPFGYSGWKYEVYNALADAGLIRARRDADGAWDWSSDDQSAVSAVDEIVAVAIRHLAPEVKHQRRDTIQRGHV